MIKLEIGKKYRATSSDITYVEPITIDFTGLYALCAIHYIPSAEIDGSVREDIWYYVNYGIPLNVTRFSCIIVGELTSPVQKLPQGGLGQVLTNVSGNRISPYWMGTDLGVLIDRHNAENKKIQCECGAHKIRHAMHSSWCPIYSTGGVK